MTKEQIRNSSKNEIFQTVIQENTNLVMSNGMNLRYINAMSKKVLPYWQGEVITHVVKNNDYTFQQARTQVALWLAKINQAVCSDQPFGFRYTPIDVGDEVQMFKVDQESGIGVPFSAVRIGVAIDHDAFKGAPDRSFKKADLFLAIERLAIQSAFDINPPYPDSNYFDNSYREYNFDWPANS